MSASKEKSPITFSFPGSPSRPHTKNDEELSPNDKALLDLIIVAAGLSAESHGGVARPTDIANRLASALVTHFSICWHMMSDAPSEDVEKAVQILHDKLIEAFDAARAVLPK